MKLDNIYEKMIAQVRDQNFHQSNMFEKLTLQEEEEERSKKEDDPRVNFRFAQIANEQDIQHMVSSNCNSL